MMVTIEGSSFSSGIGPQSPISFSLLPLPACAVATGPGAHDRSPSFPCTGRHCTGKTKGGRTATASCSREELLELDAVTALKVVASKHAHVGSALPLRASRRTASRCFHSYRQNWADRARDQ